MQTPVGLIEKKCLVGYVVSVTAGIVNYHPYISLYNTFVSLLFHMKRVITLCSSNLVCLFEPVFVDGIC